MSLHLVEIHSVVSHFVKTLWPSICGFSLHRQHHLEFVLIRHLPTDSTVISARRNQISFMVKPSFSLIVLFCVYVFVLSLGKFSLNLSSQKVLKVYVQWLTHKIRLATLFDVCCYSVGYFFIFVWVQISTIFQFVISRHFWSTKSAYADNCRKLSIAD